MQVLKANKEQTCAMYSPQSSPKDTGAPEVQVAYLTHRIKYLTEHLKAFKKDYAAKLGLLKLASQRKKLLHYLQLQNGDRYMKIIQALGLKK